VYHVTPSTRSVGAPYRMTPMEIASGWVTGGAVGPVPSGPKDVHSPVEALGDVILPALLRPPCVVEFSGGRDSSVVLAVACRVARREGLQPPLPFTRRYPDLPESNEDEWQESVIAHLGLTEWERQQFVEEGDLLGPLATASLRQWGVVWPPLAHTRKTELELARGGSLLTGEGGDEVLGPRRLSALRLMMARKMPVSRANARQVALAMAPRRVRIDRYRRRFDQTIGFPWLKPEARHLLTSTLAEDAAAEPLDWRKAVRRHPQVRGIYLAMETFDLMAADVDVMRVNPLLSSGFLSALCVAGGTLGFSDRTAALQHLFPGLLPPAVLARTTKCRFNRAVFGKPSRAFVERWQGEGVDTEIVDAAALRDVWSVAEPHAMSFALLQSCWLAADA
jgi:hypothetical protein